MVKTVTGPRTFVHLAHISDADASRTRSRRVSDESLTHLGHVSGHVLGRVSARVSPAVSSSRARRRRHDDRASIPRRSCDDRVDSGDGCNVDSSGRCDVDSRSTPTIQRRFPRRSTSIPPRSRVTSDDGPGIRHTMFTRHDPRSAGRDEQDEPTDDDARRDDPAGPADSPSIRQPANAASTTLDSRTR